MNLTGTTYSFGSFGVRVYGLYGLLPLCKVSKKRIVRVYIADTLKTFSAASKLARSGWGFGNRFSRTPLVIETDLFFLRRLILTPEDPQAAIELLSAGGRTFSTQAPGLTTRSSKRLRRR